MSSVNPSDTYNGYYIKHLTDLEDELKTDYNRAQQRAREQVEDLSRSYEESSRKANERAGDTIDRIRDDMQEKYDRSRESDRAELERITRQHYDRFGRDRSNEADSLRQRLEQYTRSAETEKASHDRELHELQAGADKKFEDLGKQYEDRLQSAVEAERASAQRAHEELSEKNKSAFEEQREDSARKYENLSRARMDEQQENRRRTETLIADSKRDMDNVKAHADLAAEERLTKVNEANQRRLEENNQALRDQHKIENQELRDKIRDLVSSEGQSTKTEAEARAQAIHDYEDGWRTLARRTNETHEQEIQKLRALAEEADNHATHSAGDHLRERDTYFAGLLAKQGAESREERKAIVDRYDTAIKEMETRNVREHKYADDRLESALNSAGEERNVALEKQAESFHRSNEAQHLSDKEDIEALQRQIAKKNAPTDAMEISPAVENAVRRSVVRQYEKNLATETERNRRALDSLQTSYADRLQNALESRHSELAAHDQQHQTDMHQAEVRFVEHIQDAEAQKDIALRTAQQDHDRETESLQRVYTQAALRQKSDYDSIIQSLRDDASTRIQAARQEADFALKTQQRAFSVRENELIRDYEKKLADQKSDYESRLDDLKIQTQQAIRDSERRDKVNFDDQTRNYEQRIAQMEDQHKERERIVTQNFQDELDKVRRSNALLQSKKG